MKAKKAVLLDRDGVINKNVPKLVRPEQFELIEGAGKAIKKLNDNGFLVIVHTNQPIIAKGFCTFKEMDKIHEKMKKELKKYGAHIDKIYLCPHHPEKGFPGEVPELKIDCECRKPKPGMLLDAIKEFGLKAENCWTIGDSYTDIAAGKSAGTKTIFLTGGGSGSKDNDKHKHVKADYEKKNLLEAAKFIITTDK